MTEDLDTILVTVKKGIGIQETDTIFDGTLIVHINSVFMILHQLGVGTTDVFSVDADGVGLWSVFLPDGNDAYLSMVKSYMIMKVRSLFDPPTSGIVTSSTEKLLNEAESRLEIQASLLV